MRPLLALTLLAGLAACRTDVDKPFDTALLTQDLDGDGYGDGSDCDDADPDVHPDADELCNGVDDDCDGEVDEDAVDAPAWALDADGDGYGRADAVVYDCRPPTGYVEDATDCDDGDDDIYPGAEEHCDGVDEDCDGLTDDDAVDGELWFPDADGDTWGDDDGGVRFCTAPEGHVEEGGDCDDSDPAVSPDGVEVCNLIDDDCDGEVDEDATDMPTWYADADMDGYGDPTAPVESCAAPEGAVADATDCDDTTADRSPAAAEVCNLIDDDCDGLTDDADPSLTDALTWYADADADGYGSPESTTDACTVPAGFASATGDCDDTDSEVSPAATELCNTVDDDCDGSTDGPDAADADPWYDDADGDGYGDPADVVLACEAPAGRVPDDADCDDSDASVNPAALETCDPGDQDCDGLADDDDPDLTGAPAWYPDADADGAGDPTSPVRACAAPAGYLADRSDCDDTDPAVHPAAAEVCNLTDDDCDGLVDDDDPDVTATDTWFADVDGDGFGDDDATVVACAAPPDHVARGGDCDDGDSGASPAATEVCDGDDDDCDGDTDEPDAADATTWYDDADVDGYGDPSVSTVACDAPSGTVGNGRDCDDTNPAVSPAAAEVCNLLDDDCDGAVDDADPDVTGTSTWHPDTDTDGYGSASWSVDACVAPAGFVADATDCDDTQATAYPGNPEVCDALDNDCDGSVDEDVQTAWTLDLDGDGYGDDATAVWACDAPTPLYVPDGGDCDDDDATSFPGAPLGCDGLDHDCDGTVDHDGDGDGYADATCGGEDCDDTDPALLPEVGGGCAVGTTCLDILDAGRSTGDGVYTIDPDGWGTGAPPAEVLCDMTGGGWTGVQYAADLPFTSHFSGGDAWNILPTDFTFTLSDAQIQAIQDVSTEGFQEYVGLCEHVIHYYYTSGGNYTYAFGFVLFDGGTTPYGEPSYLPYDITVTADGCAGNGGEGGDPSQATVFEIRSVDVPVRNVWCRDCGDAGTPEYFGSPLTANPAWLR